MSHAAEPPAGRPNVRLQHGLAPLAQRQVGKSNNSGRDFRRSITTAVAHGGNAGNELRFPYRAHFLGATGAIHRVALQEHRGGDVVASAEVVEQLVQQVSVIGTLPEVMVSINNWQV